MKDDQRDELLEALRELPKRDVGEAARERILRVSGGAFEERGVDLVTRAWSRVFVPAILACAVGVYLNWAVSAASALLH